MHKQRNAHWLFPLLVLALLIPASGCDSGSAGNGDQVVTIPVAPAAPDIIEGENTLMVSWDDVEGVDAFEVWYNTSDDTAAATQSGGDITLGFRAINGLVNGTTYHVWLKAKNSAGTSGFGTAATGTPEAGSSSTPIFESLTGSGYYVSQQTGTATVTATTLGGESCTQFDGYSQDANGGICFEVQYTLDGATDFTDGYIVEYELWIDSASVDISYGQGSVWSSGYKPAYVNGPSTSPKGQWHTFSETIDSTTVFSYADGEFDITSVELVRIKVVTAGDNQHVVIGIRNVSVTAVP